MKKYGVFVYDVTVHNVTIKNWTSDKMKDPVWWQQNPPNQEFLFEFLEEAKDFFEHDKRICYTAFSLDQKSQKHNIIYRLLAIMPVDEKDNSQMIDEGNIIESYVKPGCAYQIKTVDELFPYTFTEDVFLTLESAEKEVENRKKLWDCDGFAIVNLDGEEQKPFVPLWRYSLHFSVVNGYQKQWKESFEKNIRCADAINACCSYSDFQIERFFQPLVAEYGLDRVKYVLACTLQHSDNKTTQRLAESEVLKTQEEYENTGPFRLCADEEKLTALFEKFSMDFKEAVACRAPERNKDER